MDFADKLKKIEEAKVRKEKRKEKRKTIFSGKPLNQKRSQLREKIDKLWSMYVRIRDCRLFGPFCRICKKAVGQWKEGVGYHIIPKQRGTSIRWDLDNGVLACTSCNFGEMMNRSLYRDKHVAIFGKDFIEKMEEKSRTKVKYSASELEEIRKEIELRIEKVNIDTRRIGDGKEEGN